MQTYMCKKFSDNLFRPFKVTKADVIERVGRISDSLELGTVECKIRKVVKADDKGEFYKIGKRTIVMTCLMSLKAGIRIHSLSEKDIRIDRKRRSVSLTLPRPEILTYNIPPEEIVQEWYGVTGLRSNFTDEERNDFLRQAEQDIREDKALIENVGILSDATRNAEEIIRTLLSGAGFENIDIEFK